MDNGSAQDSMEVEAGTQLYTAGQTGRAWVLQEGSIRFDQTAPGGEAGFAGLAVKGDIVGAESLLLGHYGFSATALTRCTLAPWFDAAAQPEPSALLNALASIQRRGAQAVALRCGEAASRVHRLIDIIAGARHLPGRIPRMMLPKLRDMADITALTIGTVSRTLAQMQSEGVLEAGTLRRGRPPRASS